MIVFRLKCASGHEFEAWYRDGAAFEKQGAKGGTECPICGDSRVVKAPMAPHVSTGRSTQQPEQQKVEEAAKEFTQAAEDLRREVVENFDYVGEEFPEEARRIHYGEIEKREIYGEATGEEASELWEEGVEVYPLPKVIRHDS